ncbi:DUF6020 family protein [Butyrivibrio sp. INlla16]|uniref:DUF6020 family protein n=1 Tax=Butyrivibrio sp. INlla16 TaxID=1520807 RepID=UPI00089182EF|nr:DUF6020 family protein [Butyrivibrio sp. INlla16]SDB32152.1 hypothetical protein SAMN02910263_01544 [Butyrivibrio sp. INlla16]
MLMDMRKWKKTEIIRVVFSLMVSILLVLSYRILPYIEGTNGIDDLKGDYLSGTLIIIAVIGAFVYRVLDNSFLGKIFGTTCKYTSSEYRNANGVVIFLMVMVSFSLAYLRYYPGCAMNDTITAFMTPYTSAQPPLFHFYIYHFMRIMSSLMGNMTNAFSLYMIIQMILFSLSITYSCIWLSNNRICKNIYLYCLFFVLNPVISRYAVTLVKDVPFSYCFLLFIPCVFDVIEKRDNISDIKRTTYIMLIISSAGIWFTRSNGRYVIIASCLFIAFVLTGKKRKFCIFLIAMIVVMSLISSFADYNNFKVAKKPEVSFRESTGIMISQIGAVIRVDGVISDEDREFLNGIMPIDKWKANYLRTNVDAVKYNNSFSNGYLNDNKMKFIEVYLDILSKNPDICVNAYLNHTYGLWSLCYGTPLYEKQSIFSSIGNNITDKNTFWAVYLGHVKLQNEPEMLPKDIKLDIDSIYDGLTESMMRFFRVIAILFQLFSAYWIVTRVGSDDKNKRLATIGSLIPIYVFSVTNFMATPASLIYRYQFPITLVMPLCMMLIINASRIDNNDIQALESI